MPSCWADGVSLGKKNNLLPIKKEVNEQLGEILNTLIAQGFRLSSDLILLCWGDAEGYQYSPLIKESLSLYAKKKDIVPDLETLFPEEPKGRFFFAFLEGCQGRAAWKGFFDVPVATALEGIRNFYSLTRQKNRRPPLKNFLDAMTQFSECDNQTVIGIVSALLTDAIPSRGIRNTLLRALLKTPEQFFLLGLLFWVNRKENNIMDPFATDVGYNLGRLFAVMERIQDKDYGSSGFLMNQIALACNCPRITLTRLLSSSAQSEKRLSRDGRTKGLAIWLGRVKDTVIGDMGIEVPESLSTEQREQFYLGFHAMRRWFFFTKAERAKWAEGYEGLPSVFEPKEVPAEELAEEDTEEKNASPKKEVAKA